MEGLLLPELVAVYPLAKASSDVDPDNAELDEQPNPR
jgi:hypothetical protein